MAAKKTTKKANKKTTTTSKVVGSKLKELGSKTQQSALDRKVADNAPHVIVEARAGTGKTTTLVEGLKVVKGIESSLIPSPQQGAVWKTLALSKNHAKSIGFAAFNRAIADELQKRVPENCDAMTMHSMGLRAVTARFGRVDINKAKWVVQDRISELLGVDLRDLKKDDFELLVITEKLVSLCKMNLIGFDYVFTGGNKDAQTAIRETLSNLAAEYDIDLNGSAERAFDLVPRVLDGCKDPSKDRRINYDDMIWLPVVLDLPVYQYDLLLVDEAQDLNRCQQALALKAGKRLVLCGDPKQAIYGFAGADSESMSRMESILSDTERGCVHLPLTVTRRCGKAIVEEAKKYVPDFEAHESNPQGMVNKSIYDSIDTSKTYHNMVANFDMIICRVNAPLVSQCFKFLKEGRRANIRGRDVGNGLISTINRMQASDIVDLESKLSDWYSNECEKENTSRYPNENRLIALQDRYDCLKYFIEDQKTVQDVIDKINSIFTDNENTGYIMLSSIHKAKGLEASRVFLLQPVNAPIPHPMAKSARSKEQEYNLLYVAITRAIEELVYVS